MKVKRVPDEGKRGDCVDTEYTLRFIISTISAKCRRDLQNTRAGTYVGFETDRGLLATRLHPRVLPPVFFPDVARSRRRTPRARRHPRDHDPFY